MRHNKKFRHLSRKTAHRNSMLANMTVSLIMHKRIETTLAKAKALRVYAEPIINRAKKDDTHSRRVVFSYLQNKAAVTELFKEVSQKIADRPGGYLRIIKLGIRKSDAAEMAFIEFVDYNENMAKTVKKATRTRRSSRKSAAEKVAPATEVASKAASKTAIEAPAKAAVEAPAKAPAEAPAEVALESASAKSASEAASESASAKAASDASEAAPEAPAEVAPEASDEAAPEVPAE